MKCIINSEGVVSRSLEGPLARHIGSFAEQVGELGYALGSLKKQVRIAASFSRWLGQRTIPLRNISSEHTAQFLKYRARRTVLDKGDAAALRRLIEFLRRQGVIPTRELLPTQLTPAERCARAYEQYLREARALARATIINYAPYVRSFLNDRFGEGPVTLSRLRARDVVSFVQRQAPRMQTKRAKHMTSALRSFLRYARLRGELMLDLAAAVPVVANWSMSSIPRAIAADQVRQLLASVDLRSATGRRDYAILLLLARLGLRSGEVACLELDDIDWNAAQLRVRGKSGQRGELPLSAEVGQAIAAYLRRGRPPSTSRRVFLRAKAPSRGFRGPSGVGSVVRHWLIHAGVSAPTHGAHQFRHALATQMLRRGASLGEIGEVLGHRHPQTTTIYAKVDLQALRTLALPWPGGVR